MSAADSHHGHSHDHTDHNHSHSHSHPHQPLLHQPQPLHTQFHLPINSSPSYPIDSPSLPPIDYSSISPSFPPVPVSPLTSQGLERRPVHDPHHGHSHASPNQHHNHSHADPSASVSCSADSAHHGHSHGSSWIPKLSLSVPSVSQLLVWLSAIGRDVDSQRVFYYILLKVSLTIIQFLFGLYEQNYGLISNSFHTGFDCLALFTSLFAIFNSKRRSSDAYSYGFERFEIVAAFTNSIFLFFVAVFTAIETFHTYYDPPEWDKLEIAIVLLSILVDFIALGFFYKFSSIRSSDPINPTHSSLVNSQRILHSGRGRSLNLHGVFLHSIADLFSHFAFLCGAAISSWHGISTAFAVLYAATAFLIVKFSFPLFYQSGLILSQSVDENVRTNLDRCLREISFFDGVLECRHANWWTQSPGIIVGTMLVRVRADANEQAILQFINSVMKKYVADLTIQIEKDAPMAWMG